MKKPETIASLKKIIEEQRKEIIGKNTRISYLHEELHSQERLEGEIKGLRYAVRVNQPSPNFLSEFKTELLDPTIAQMIDENFNDLI